MNPGKFNSKTDEVVTRELTVEQVQNAWMCLYHAESPTKPDLMCLLPEEWSALAYALAETLQERKYARIH
jgi:hypothetical protein